MDQIFNPFLPLHEYIADGEPHIFGNRVYLFGSHDKEGGETFCMLDYAVYSANINDLKHWHYEGIIYHASQDAFYSEERSYMYAPDVVQGNDGRFYLYYCLSGKYGIGGYSGVISVAVCDTPAGKYQYLGYVRNADGSPMKKYICFDPAVINDNGVIRLYYGTQYPYEEETDFRNDPELIRKECEMFGKSEEEILNTPDSVMGAVMCVLENDMLTVKEPSKHIIPYAVKHTDFEAHPFFEASSIRKIDQKYYFIYSSMQNHELCYAISNAPDHDFHYGGVIISNGDIGLHGRAPEDRLNMTGTNHGSLICIRGQWYIFYHRLTHKSDYSRQACAERIEILPDGSIPQVGVTSCGLNGEPLRAEGIYPAVIACHITNGHMPHGSNQIFTEHFPHVAHEENQRFIAEISDGTLIGYQYFHFPDHITCSLKYQSTGEGCFRVYTDLQKKQYCGEFPISINSDWTETQAALTMLSGNRSFYLEYIGTGECKLLEISFLPEKQEIKIKNLPGFFTALSAVGIAFFFLAVMSFAGNMMHQLSEQKTLESTAPTSESLYFPPTVTETESYHRPKQTITEPTANKIYESGSYEVGKDLPAGLYLAKSNTSFGYGDFYFGIYNQPYQEGADTEKIGGGWYQNFGFFELENGQYIHFAHSDLYPADSITENPDPWKSSGMFRVGIDIKPGTYILTADQEYDGTYSVYPDAKVNSQPIIEENYIGSNDHIAITIHKGELLKTSFCTITDGGTAQQENGIPAGSYLIGKDLPAGLYLAFTAGNPEENPSFQLDVYDSPEKKNILIGGWSQTCRYVDLEDGQYLVFSDAILYDESHFPILDPYAYSGMFQIGRDLPKGVHSVFSSASGMIVIYDSVGKEAAALSSESMTKEYTIIDLDLEQGKFIQLRNCHLAR